MIRKKSIHLFLIFFFLFIYLFIGCIGSSLLHTFCSCGERGLLFVVVHWFLIAVASLLAEHRLSGARASVVVARGL